MAGDDDGFITLPPGLIDPNTLKAAPKPERRRAESDEVVFLPAAPGVPVPTAAPDVEPEPVSVETRRELPDRDEAQPERAPQPEPRHAEPAPETAETPVVAPVAQWRLVLADGREVPVARSLLIGRNPAPFDAWPGAELLAVVDGTHSVSKTHAAFEVDDSGIWVHDLGSTNGVWVVHGDDVTESAPGRRVRIPEGATVEFGDYVLTVRR
ncbi:FHA domain-containing protein [Protaetiibacter mangrovi]|uniref:FHA domain-containing protein n=1 Tax=Protaetiibacter mangrovi TaxID=2970926 RepID=A0ABT1ZHZ9_9MICO|nr:FHA domain-containing protein [Protaetiibacter mangrovi]MCS0500355.1 FHA domain-containing protein [Protaetiibacter mangrovi]TPX02660.1 FHA domain-containing protein [Schumannella luteola]